MKDEIEKLIDKLLRDADDFDTEAGRNLLEEFCSAVKISVTNNGEYKKAPNGAVIESALNPKILLYLMDCFNIYLKDTSLTLEHALSLSTGRPGGKEKKGLLERNINICSELWHHTNQRTKCKHEIVAAKYNLSSEYVRRHIWGNADLKEAGKIVYGSERDLSKLDGIDERRKRTQIDALKKRLKRRGIEPIGDEEWVKIREEIWDND